MSHTWHKVLYAAKRRSRIPMHPASVWMMGPSCIYGRTSRRLFTRRGEQEGEMEKQLLFFFLLLLLSTIPMLPIMCQTNKSGGKKIEAHSPSTRNQLGSLGVRISDLCSRSVSAPQYSLIHPRPLSLRGAILVLFCERASSSTYRMRFVPIKKIYVQRKPP